MYLEAFGTGLLVLNSLDITADLLEKRATNYSDRPSFVMIGDLMGLNNVPSYLLILTVVLTGVLSLCRVFPFNLIIRRLRNKENLHIQYSVPTRSRNITISREMQSLYLFKPLFEILRLH